MSEDEADWESQPEFYAAIEIEPLIFGEDHACTDDDWELLRRIVREVRSADARRPPLAAPSVSAGPSLTNEAGEIR